MGNGWDDVEQLLVGSATDDLSERGEVTPCLVAFAGDDLRVIAFWRPFAKGAYHDPLIELLALAMPLGADRFALSIAGRGWSLDDPIPPVSADADLRQRLLVVELVDATGDEVRHDSVLHPFDLDTGGPRWQDPQRLPGGTGWIGEVLKAAAAAEEPLTTDDAEIARQARRCVHLGHDLHLPPDIALRLAAATATAP
jgi:hypothetical protein